MNDKTFKWYKATKIYRNAEMDYQFRVPSELTLEKSDWDEILEYIGEKTAGGHSYGYRIEVEPMEAKHETLPVVRLPAGLIAGFEEYAEEVIVKQYWI